MPTVGCMTTEILDLDDLDDLVTSKPADAGGDDRSLAPRLGWGDRAALTALVAAALTTALDGPMPWPLIRAAAIVAVAVALVRARTVPARVRSAVLGLIGLLTAAYGGGYGAMYALKDPASLTAVTGLATLIAGVATLIAGVAGLLRGTRWWTKLVSIPAALAVTFVLGMPIGLGVAQTNVPPLRLGDRTPASVGLAYDDVELTTADGVDLDAWYVPSMNGAAVVLLAGAGSVRSDEVDRAAAIARHGYGVLLLDVRGHGGSEGEPMLLGWYGERDVRPAVDWLLERPEVTGGRVGVVGMSMGGQQAVAAAGDDSRIRAVVADGVVGRHSSELDAPTAVDTFLGWLSMETAEMLTEAPHPVPLRDAARAATASFLVVAAERVGLEQDFSEILVDAAADRVDVWVAPDSGHTGAFGRHPHEWERRVTEFLDATLV